MRSANFHLKIASLSMNRLLSAVFGSKLSISTIVITLLAMFVQGSVQKAEAVEIGSLSLMRDRSFISVKSSLVLDEAQTHDLENGVEKEYIFYIDLFRKWEFWPDEFIYGIKQERKIKSDPIKKEFLVTVTSEISNKERRFNSLESLLDQALKVDITDVFSTIGLPAGTYFVRVTVESRIRKLAPIIGYLLFFVPEKEFTVVRDSDVFEVRE